jgi:signal transduction histidine kinase
LRQKIGYLVLLLAGTAFVAGGGFVLAMNEPVEIRRVLGHHFGALIVVATAAFALATFICFWLRSEVVGSILRLSHSVQQVPKEQNCEPRFRGGRDDDIGQLGNSINELLAVIESQNVSIRALRERLEQSSTEHRKADAEVARLNRELMLNSRQARMAEVATGVLHNVGNVLNSINVSATLVGNRLRQSRVSNLGKALGLLREHRSNLAGFLTNDSKGKMLPAYLETLTDHLAAEQAEMSREMESLGKNVEHVKEIVTMQQNYARLCGVSETLQISELVQDAIRMNLGAFERHGVTIVQEFAEVPPVTVDKHKVLQILINLMRNAKYAMDEQAPAEKRLTIGISGGGKGHVVVSMRDNGIGIAPDNLPRIFAHGFTTKRDGHGFGLHSGALAAREMGGRLTASSEGIGKGAVFCLELPVAPAELEQAEDENQKRNVDGIVQT